jgi:hypothetical protein
VRAQIAVVRRIAARLRAEALGMRDRVQPTRYAVRGLVQPRSRVDTALAPWPVAPPPSTITPMSTASLHAAAADVVTAGQAFSGSVAASDPTAALADGLDALASSLHIAAHACRQAVTASVPQTTSHSSSGARYRQARENWPTSTLPSNERLARMLGSLHDAAGAIRAAADHCVQARDAVDAARNGSSS